MKITVTSGRKFHSDHLAAALMRKDALELVITANPPSAYRRHSFPSDLIHHTFPFYVPGWLISRMHGGRELSRWLDWWATRKFDKAAANRIGSPDVVVAFAWSARNTFEKAKAKGIRCVLEECGSANAHQEKLLDDEHNRLGLKKRIGVRMAVIENEQEECAAADVILCPSDYVADSFGVYGINRDRCIVIPYASNPRFVNNKTKRTGGKFRILFVGSIGPRKGIVYLLQALQNLPPGSFECTVIGRVEPGFELIFSKFRSLVNYIPSVPHERMPSFFEWASVFVLPTLDEGMAYVIMEALASGTPVITTAHSGATRVVKHQENGFIVEIRDVEAISKALTMLADSPEFLENMSKNAKQSAIAWTWDDYVGRLIAELDCLISSNAS